MFHWSNTVKLTPSNRARPASVPAQMNPSPVMASARTLLPGSPEPPLHTLATNRPGAKTEDAPGFSGAWYETAPDFAGAVFLAVFFGAPIRGVTARQAIAAMTAPVKKRIRIPSILNDPAARYLSVRDFQN